MIIREYMEGKQPYLNPLFGVVQMSEHFKVSSDTMIKWCKKEYGVCPKEIISNYRISHAKMLIAIGGYNATELYDRCGFQYRTVFHKVFKRITGMTPGQYRKNELKNISGNRKALVRSGL